MRCETGVVEFEEDWPGVFIRGDNALHYALTLRGFLRSPSSRITDRMATVVLEELVKLLESCNVTSSPEAQELQKFERCRRESDPTS